MPRSYWYDRPRPDAPPLGFPADPALVPDDWTVWAFADIHGMAAPFREALEKARLVDADGRWVGGSRVALVGLGDYIDRGPESAGVVDILRVLGPEMAAADSRLVLVRGNHEQMLADILRGYDDWFESWSCNGGEALARSYGVPSPSRGFGQLVTNLLDKASELLPWLLATHACARWRDVIFVHAALPAGGTPGTLADDDRQLWDPDHTFVSGAGIALEPGLAGFRAAGIERVVIGHYPQVGLQVDHDGTLLLLDTNACGIRTLGGVRMDAFVTLARIPPAGSYDDARVVMVNALSGS
jgi:hypothetical protein